MPKVIEYPSSSFSKVLELAYAVDYFGGNCTVQSCADKLNKKVSGGFGMLVSAAIKHNLISRKREDLFTTQLYKDIKGSTDDKQKTAYLRKAFLSPVLYKKVYDRFKDKEIPLPSLDKLLEREFAVEADYGSRIAGYFIDGIKFLHLLDGNKLIDINTGQEPQVANNQEIDLIKSKVQHPELKNDPLLSKDNSKQNTAYIIYVTGPGMDSTISINEEEDFFILEAITRKIKKRLQGGGKD